MKSAGNQPNHASRNTRITRLSINQWQRKLTMLLPRRNLRRKVHRPTDIIDLELMNYFVQLEQFHLHRSKCIQVAYPGKAALFETAYHVSTILTGELTTMFHELAARAQTLLFPTHPRPGLEPIPGTKPLSIQAAVAPPLIYYIALLFLAPSPPPFIRSVFVGTLRNVLALVAGILFFRLPLAYHVPQSIGLTYQLGLVGIYGGCRVMDTFFISPYLFNHVPRRVQYRHHARVENGQPEHSDEKEWTDGGVKDPFTHGEGRFGLNRLNEALRRRVSTVQDPSRGQERASTDQKSTNNDNRTTLSRMRNSISGPDPQPVYEIATTEAGWPQTFADRAAWALELELSMRGVGFTWTTADVRHTRKTWLPSTSNRVHSILFHVGPILLISWAIIRTTYLQFLTPNIVANLAPGENPFDDLLPIPCQLVLTGALGAFLMAAFSLGHSLFAIMLSPLAPSPLAFFPPLYTTRVWNITNVRKFWSFGWHRLFARLFLVYGVWPGQWIERKLTGKTAEQPADIGKVLGGFLSSAFVHSFSVRAVLGGDWKKAGGEAIFFTLNGVAVVLEEVVRRSVRSWRKQKDWPAQAWYDAWIGRAWWIGVVLWTGRNFARGWVNANLVREMAFM
jgi:hypothetical protein